MNDEPVRTLRRTDDDLVRLDEEMAELSLLMPGWQAEELEQAAVSQGLTAGQLVRLLLKDAVAKGAHLQAVRYAF
jgi:hypothetical protein